MRRTAALQGVRMLKFMDVFGRWEATELSQLERRSCWGWASGHSAAGAGVMRKRMTLPAGPPDRQGVGQARSGGPERGGGGVVSDAVFGLHGAALPRASGARSPVCLELQLDEAFLQSRHLLAKAPRRGAHQRKRPRRPLPGMMLHQDGSWHVWLTQAHHSTWW